jgi:O-antigen ligase
MVDGASMATSRVDSSMAERRKIWQQAIKSKQIAE